VVVVMSITIQNRGRAREPRVAAFCSLLYLLRDLTGFYEIQDPVVGDVGMILTEISHSSRAVYPRT